MEKKCDILVVKRPHFSNFLDVNFTVEKILDCDWTWTEGWIWIEKYDSLLISACGNTSLSLKFGSDFLVSTKCKVIFAAASFRNSAAQFF